MTEVETEAVRQLITAMERVEDIRDDMRYNKRKGAERHARETQLVKDVYLIKRLKEIVFCSSVEVVEVKQPEEEAGQQ